MEELKQELEEKFVEEANIKETGELFRFIEYNSDFIQWLITKISQVEPEVKPACFDWQKERPNKPCVVMTRVWNKNLEIYDYNIWRFEKIDCDGGWYLGWLTEDGEEWDDINDCHFDEYCIIESKSV